MYGYNNDGDNGDDDGYADDRHDTNQNLREWQLFTAIYKLEEWVEVEYIKIGSP